MILEALAIVAGLACLMIGLIFNFQFLSFVPSACLILFGLTFFIMERYYNCFAILINNFNGKKTFKVLRAKKFYQNSNGKMGYFLAIQGFKKVYPYPANQFINLNLTQGMNNLIFFYQENDALAPCDVIASKNKKAPISEPNLIACDVSYDLDAVKFISNELIANAFQMEGIVKNIVKPPQETLTMIIQISLILCMIACIISMIYMGYKNGINAGIFEAVGVKVDMMLNKLGEFMIKIEGGVGNIGGLTNSTLGNIPPITGLG
jgi:hypothetical protein